MDINKDYTNQTIQLQPDYEGEVIATLIASKANQGNRKSVLYLHGYVDYFFQAHVGKKFIENDFDFYALDLRKYGRSLMDHQHPNYCKNIEEYFEEITIAIRQIHSDSNGEVYVLGHSTGGLIAANYMNFGEEKDLIKALILNSPFLDFNQSDLTQSLVYLASLPVAGLSKYAKVNGALSPAYVKSIHKDFHGEWDFDLKLKPVKGFPTYYKWILAMRSAQRKLSNSNIRVPILVMHSHTSEKMSKFSEKAMKQDIVLNVMDIKREGMKLGQEVTLSKIDNGMHDLFLSTEKARKNAFFKMFDWLKNLK
ncbi:alpha/beta hydrolase [Brumimicrobium mesophilum]|uniref:alpha/beta hydrolase n=1 Tax=Brumimicrobium mesophilum TaxID=392717 RepID=UPI000D142972|nr:alpha/beta hydrolase [Brumimicrobium mesophilum]